MYKCKKTGFLGILFLVFVTPMVVAALIYAIPSWKPAMNNNGELITPPRAMGNLIHLTRKWHMVYVEPTECNENCQSNLYKMRQIRLALGKDMNRVDRVLITFNEKPSSKMVQLLAQSYKGTEHFVLKKQTFDTLLAGLAKKNSASSQENLFLVDPMGNLMMRYSATQPPKGIYNDLKRLLSVSQIG